MKIDFQKPILGLDGQPIMNGDKPFLLVNACQEGLTASYQDENPPPTPIQKVERFVLAMKIANVLPVDLTIEEAAEIKKLVGKAYGPVVVGRIYEIFEAKEG